MKDSKTPEPGTTSVKLASEENLQVQENTGRTSGGSDDRNDKGTWIVGGLVWIGIIAVILVPRLWTKSANIVLEVRPGDPLVVNGFVLYRGSPVNTGYVQLTLDEPRTKRFLSSTVLPVTKEGSFSSAAGSSGGSQMHLSGTTNKQLRITAAFHGQAPDKSGTGTNVLSGESVVFTNFSPPVAKVNLWTGVAIVGLFIAMLTVLFTGPLSRRKARCLFAVTYLMTFVSIAVPLFLILLVSQNHYIVEVMQNSPVGLVKAKTKAVSDPQWLLNIGGTVEQRAADAGSVSVAAPPANGRTDSPGEATIPRAGTSRPDANNLADSTLTVATVVGGLAIPFYVLILAMFGAGINMTRQVPDIQKRYDIRSLPQGQSALAATLAAPLNIFKTGDNASATEHQTNATAGIRRDIIESYMGLISAPFLAIAIYYVLQIVATSVAEPILVLMAFATGLISDVVVNWIINFARSTLQQSPGGGADDMETTRLESTVKLKVEQKGAPALQAPPAAG